MFDLILKNGRIIDGTGNPWFRADIAIKGDVIDEIRRHVSKQADRVIDAKDFIISPGFIDIHQHSDLAVFVNPSAENMVMQGITTMVYGHCGSSPAPLSESRKERLKSQERWKTIEFDWNTFREYFEKLKKQGISTNVASFVGHSTIREIVMGFENKYPTPKEMDEMKVLVANAMEDGAVGLSTGLDSPPGSYSTTDEIVELCKVVAKYDGIYTVHRRDASKKGFVSSIKEAVEIGEKADCKVQISHIETHYDAWGLQEEVMKIVDESRNFGLDVTCDVCVHIYGGDNLANLVIPDWAFEGGPEKMLERLKDPAIREKMKMDVITKRKSHSLASDGLWNDIIILSNEKHPEFMRKSLAVIAKEWEKDPWEAAFDLLIDNGLKCREVSISMKSHHEADVRTVLKNPVSMPITDAQVFPPHSPLSEISAQPRAYGALPLVFRKYVRGETRSDLPEEIGSKILTIEDAVRKMTSLPAQVLGLQNRGILREGSKADIVIFDSEKITDKATYLKPHQYPDGIPYVIVNGTLVVDEGKHKGALPGEILYGPGHRPNN